MEWILQDTDGGIMAHDGKFYWSVWETQSGRWMATTPGRGGVLCGVFDNVQDAVDAAEAMSASWRFVDDLGMDLV